MGPVSGRLLSEHTVALRRIPSESEAPAGRAGEGGVRTRRHPARRGFTLLEIVLAIAIMGLIATALIGGATSMLSTKPTSPDAVFWSAVFQARKKALEASADVQLSYDPKAQAFVVNDGTEAMAHLRSGGVRPDLVLLDLNMPKMDGRQVLAAMKGDESLKSIPTVILTTSNAEADITKCYQLQANSYHCKPVEFLA